MRNAAALVFVALTAFAGFETAGCALGSSSVGEPTGSSSDDTEVGRSVSGPSGSGASSTTAPSPAEPATEDDAAPQDEGPGDARTWRTNVTSTAEAPDGTRYSAGPYSGVIHIGDQTLASRGQTDIFLFKQSKTGAIEWAVSVGSQQNERQPRVSINDDGGVNLLGMTDGDVNCGSGPMKGWYSQTFFLCIFGADDGANTAGGAFPTGQP